MTNFFFELQLRTVKSLIYGAFRYKMVKFIAQEVLFDAHLALSIDPAKLTFQFRKCTFLLCQNVAPSRKTKQQVTILNEDQGKHFPKRPTRNS